MPSNALQKLLISCVTSGEAFVHWSLCLFENCACVCLYTSIFLLVGGVFDVQTKPFTSFTIVRTLHRSLIASPRAFL